MTTVVPSHSTVAPCSRQSDFRWVVVLQQPPANPNPVTNPLLHALTRRLASARCGCGVLLYVDYRTVQRTATAMLLYSFLRICSLLLAGCINSRRKRKDSIQAWDIQEDLPRNQITSTDLILLLKVLSPNTFKLLLIFIRVYHDWILSCLIPALAGFCNADCTSSGSLDKSNLNFIHDKGWAIE